MPVHFLHERQWHIAFGIYVLSDLNVEDAVTYCRMQGPVDQRYCKEVLEQRYLIEPVEEINSIFDESHNWRDLRTDINRWLAEHALYEWVRCINETAAVAPSYDMVYEEFNRIRADYKLSCDGGAAYGSRKKWVSRWMARWKLTRTAVVSHEGSSSLEIVQKVPPVASNMLHIHGEKPSCTNAWNGRNNENEHASELLLSFSHRKV